MREVKVAACTLLSKQSECQVVTLVKQGDQRLQEGLAPGIVWLTEEETKIPFEFQTLQKILLKCLVAWPPLEIFAWTPEQDS